MPWFPVDDGFAFHHKAVKAGNAAIGLWTRAGSWCSQQLTDGYVPDEIVPVLGTTAQARRLVRVGLWDEVDGGYQFHGWTEDERNPTRSKVSEARQKASERKAKYRAAKRAEDQVNEGSPSGTQPSVPAGHPTGHDRGRVSTPLHSTPELSDESSPPCSPPPGDGAKRPAKREPDRFDEFWKTYPKRVGKQAAIKAWRKALGIADADTIIEGARRYAVSRNGEDPQYTAHPSTWLNAGRWDDEPQPKPPVQRPVSTRDQRIAETQRLKAQFCGTADEPDTGPQLRAISGGFG